MQQINLYHYLIGTTIGIIAIVLIGYFIEYTINKITKWLNNNENNSSEYSNQPNTNKQNRLRGYINRVHTNNRNNPYEYNKGVINNIEKLPHRYINGVTPKKTGGWLT